LVNVILHGCNGKMGRVVTKLIESDPEMNLVAGIDENKDKYTNSFPVYADPFSCKEKADVLIDFSHYSALPNLLKYCLDNKLPLVIATTGLNEENIESLEKASQSIPIFRTANMSLGVNVVTDLAKKAAHVLSDAFDIEIIEKHHNKKVDSPSGTAYLIADAIKEVFNGEKSYVYGRHGKNDKRNTTDIGIHAVRGGSIVGEHTVIFAGPDEIIEIKHTALSKDIFALGAIRAAKFLMHQQNGLYNMNDLLK
jgi:4-hydroxy-tetrahydrodipicolinate reductase